MDLNITYISGIVFAALPYLTDLLLIIFASAVIYFSLMMMNQSWVRTFPHTATIFFIPIITYAITKAISGNIALSLGMVGALSLIRFRNPVRSPFELTVYFATISMGIIAGANTKLFLIYIFSLALISFLFFIAILYSRKYLNKELFNISFTEGNSIPSLSVNSPIRVDFIEESTSLRSLSKVDNTFNYILSCQNKKALYSLTKKLDNLDNVSYEFDS